MIFAVIFTGKSSIFYEMDWQNTVGTRQDAFKGLK